MHEGHVSCPSMDLQLVYFWKTLYILEAILLVHKRTVWGFPCCSSVQVL